MFVFPNIVKVLKNCSNQKHQNLLFKITVKAELSFKPAYKQLLSYFDVSKVSQIKIY